ncbi:hypothetical protein NDU88_003681 [Pleurodeles waltl]|uniref:Uncharacterized protein n=1 Tax=Pleurodeles waltl TaxID=8319 RepID=A0AAV7UZ67_PLEWA|nr:hypothetical protein NDU88_003681 [Pleurodeles waltl]
MYSQAAPLAQRSLLTLRRATLTAAWPEYLSVTMLANKAPVVNAKQHLASAIQKPFTQLSTSKLQQNPG